MVEKQKIQDIDMTEIDSIISEYSEQKWGLIPLLQEIQETIGYIPPEVIPRIANSLHLFPSHIQGVISFYAQFCTEPRGKNVVRVCRGTACHVRGGKTILKLTKQHLGIEENETTPDYNYTLETIACIGVCALAPNIVINRDNYGHMNPKKLARLFGTKDEA
jgi:NADH:ubiquinone oxidoreductase subunit E